MEVRVGPLVVTIHSDDQFLVCQPDATVDPSGAQGYFVADTRLVSDYRLTLSGIRPVLVNSAAVAPSSARFEFVNDAMETVSGRLECGRLHLRVDRTIGDGIHEDYDLVTYAAGRVELDLEIRLEGDFADLLDVKAGKLIRRGTVQTSWDQDAGDLRTCYSNQDFQRGLCLQVDRQDSPAEFANGTLSFRVALEPRAHWHACLLWVPTIGGESPARLPPERCHALVGGDSEGDHQGWTAQVTSIETADSGVDAVIDRAVLDLAAMRLRRHDPGPADPNGGATWVAAAGIPWFVSLFGRDSLVVSLQTLMLSPRFAQGALAALAPLQSGGYDDAHDAQPGKIQHEIRHGELAHFHLVPQTPYYGTADATILYVWAAAEVWRWTGDRRALAGIRANVERALAWIDTDGDLDGDGLQEYRTRAGDWGFYNQAWKDSGAAIVNADGSRAKLPIAVCELQGYVVAAKRAWADAVEQAFDDASSAMRLRAEADRLVEAIEDRFWWAEEGTYYLGLDGDKQPIESVASNPGHLLWSGAVGADRAASVVARLLADDMWSGWGVRTLSGHHRSYNPFSYQRGSVWPHDNAILAAGFARYGHHQEAWQVGRALFDAAARFQHNRLPEVFAGLEREAGSFPAQYLGANVPQAWASGGGDPPALDLRRARPCCRGASPRHRTSTTRLAGRRSPAGAPGGSRLGRPVPVGPPGQGRSPARRAGGEGFFDARVGATRFVKAGRRRTGPGGAHGDRLPGGTGSLRRRHRRSRGHRQEVARPLGAELGAPMSVGPERSSSMTVDGPETDGDEAGRRYLRALDLRRAAPPGMRPDDTASALAAEVDDGDDGHDGDDALAVLLAEGTPGSLGDLAPAFVAGAARYGKRHHVTCEGWLGAGVDPDVLAGAGIRPDR